MKRDSFAYGLTIGVAVALAFSIAIATAIKHLPDATLVNFGPALLGFGLFAMEILAAAVALVAAGVFLVRKSWKRAGFALSFALTVAGWLAIAIARSP